MSAAVVDAMSPLPLPLPGSFGILPSSSSSPSSSHLGFLALNRLATDLSAPFLRLRISNGGRAVRSVVCLSVYSSKSPSQCAGCLVYHKFVDNLGLVVQYDLCEEEYDVDSDGTN